MQKFYCIANEKIFAEVRMGRMFIVKPAIFQRTRKKNKHLIARSETLCIEVVSGGPSSMCVRGEIIAAAMSLRTIYGQNKKM
jgi:hypothetical protein